MLWTPVSVDHRRSTGQSTKRDFSNRDKCYELDAVDACGVFHCQG